MKLHFTLPEKRKDFFCIVFNLICIFLFLLGCSANEKNLPLPLANSTTFGQDSAIIFESIRHYFVPHTNKIIAHRGAWKNTGVPENSIASLQKAVKLGCYGSEFDVHMSADSILFICHDDNFQGFLIEKTHSDKLINLKLSNGEPLPTLDKYIKEALKQNHTRLILEIKPSIVSSNRGIAAAEKIVKLVRFMNAQDWVQYVSFDYNICKRVKKMEPKVSVAFLGGGIPPAQLEIDQLDMDYAFTVLQNNESWIDSAQQKNLSINSWTVDTKPIMTWLILVKKIDFITTNEPELAFSILK